MFTLLEVPSLFELYGLGITVELHDEAGVASLTAWANDGDSVTLTWDEIARSATIRWVSKDGERFRLEREMATRITVTEDNGCVRFRVWSRSSDLCGQTVVQINERVVINDALLQC